MRAASLHSLWLALAVAVLWIGGATHAQAQSSLAWDASQYFEYNIDSVTYNSSTRVVTVVFSVTNPKDGDSFWNIKSDTPFVQSPSLSRLAVVVGWDTSDFTNTGASGEDLAPVVFGSGIGAALPISINALRDSQALTGASTGRFLVTATLPKKAECTGAVAIEGHPAWPVSGTMTSVPVKAAVRNFVITKKLAPRREIVDIRKCQECHTGRARNGVTIPRLSLHGGNRTENLGLCVICHNPNQTDVPYRTSGVEVSVDFKRMIHGIHAAKVREKPLVIVGFRGSINDFSEVRFPGELKNCVTCHIDGKNGGTFELPLAASVLGTTVNTRSTIGTTVDVNPANDLKITPIAAICSACHDEKKDLSHMSSNGARFSVLQSQIDSGAVREKCVDCHGPGRKRDVRKAHSIDDYKAPEGSGGGSKDEEEDEEDD